MVSGHKGERTSGASLPHWLPPPLRLYIAHVEGGQSLRALARAHGMHASTLLRQVRRAETLRDDPLADAALTRMGAAWRLAAEPRSAMPAPQDASAMTSAPSAAAAHEAEILRVLKALAAPETELLVTEKLADAVLVLNPAGGRPTRLGAVARDLAESLVLRGFIAGRRGKALTRYRITQAGRGEMMRLVAERESRRAAVTGRAEDADAADGAEALFGAAAGGAGAARSGSSADHRAAGARSRTAGAESPLLVLARRKAPDGKPFLGEGEVAAGFRFRTSFEIARMDAGFTRDWDRLIAGKVSGSGPAGAGGSAPTRRLDAARDLEAALRRLGPDLSEVAILALCEELGMEAVERRLGLSARAGKNILKIALRMLERHYHSAGSAEFDMIG